MKYLLNGFNLKMLSLEEHIIKIEKTSKQEIDKIKHDTDCVSAIGHCHIGKQLNVPTRRMDIQLEKGDIAYIIRSNKNARRKYSIGEEDTPKTLKWIYQKCTVLS